jgi:hypothetical protein
VRCPTNLLLRAVYLGKSAAFEGDRKYLMSLMMGFSAMLPSSSKWKGTLNVFEYARRPRRVIRIRWRATDSFRDFILFPSPDISEEYFSRNKYAISLKEVDMKR